MRTGDTPAKQRAQFGREAADILITTPESLYLLLTSNARDRLRSVETVIIDEIHALVSTKRGANQFHGTAYATAMSLIVLQLPNNYLPILQK